MAITLALLFLFPLSLYPRNTEEVKQSPFFNHKTHAGDNEISCEFCHSYARRSNISGTPSLESCMRCHKVVLGSDGKLKEEIQAFLKQFENGEPIVRQKIHHLPGFVSFSHKRHIRIGYDCTECHGEMDKLEVINSESMITDLSMGWCITCHKTRHPSIQGNVVGPERKTRGGPVIKTENDRSPDGTLIGSRDCYTCHK